VSARAFVGGALLAVTIGFVLEARTLRPDMTVVATVVLVLLAWQHVVRHPEAAGARRRWLIALYVSLGVGMLAKGLVPVVLAGIPIGIVTLRERGWRGVRELRPGLGSSCSAPSCCRGTSRSRSSHPGFRLGLPPEPARDDVLRQEAAERHHGRSAVVLLEAFAGRMLPWVVLLPLTFGEARQGLRRFAEPAARATAYLWLWLGGLMVFFSLAPSRLEHYCVPALPAGRAPGGARLAAGGAGRDRPVAWRVLCAFGIACTGVGIFGVLRGASIVARRIGSRRRRGSPPSPRWRARCSPARCRDGVRGGAPAGRAPRRRARPRHDPDQRHRRARRGRGRAAVLLAPAGARVMSVAGPETEIVFEAPLEYQLVAGLVFYTGRRVTLLEPPGFVPPAYLQPEMVGMFLFAPGIRAALGGRRGPRPREQPPAAPRGSQGDRARPTPRPRPLR
jgi:hypothetical protein